MKGGKTPRGFTVVETMIFLAVSALLFAAALRTIDGQQERAEFNVGIREFQSQMRDIINDVSTGYYPYRAGFGCRVSGATLDFSVAAAQGTNSDCIFIGRVVQFGPNDVGQPFEQRIRIYTVAGRRQIPSGSSTRDVFNLMESWTVPYQNASQTHLIPNGIRVRWVRFSTVAGSLPNTGTDIGQVGFFTNFTRYSDDSASLLQTEARNVNVLPVPNSNLNRDDTQASTSIRAIGPLDDNNAATTPNLSFNPSGGITACLESASGGSFVLVNIGGELRQLNNDIDIRRGDCTVGPFN